MKVYFRIIYLVSIALLSTSVNSEEISVLVLYTEAAKSVIAGGAIDDKIETYIDASNDSYTTSQINITLTLAGSRLIPGVDDSRDSENEQNYDTYAALEDLKDGTGAFATVPNLRNAFNADFVVLLRDIEDVGGLGYVNQFKNGNSAFAYSIVRIKNSLSSFTHELGHNMGLGHSRRQVENDSARGLEPYAVGHGLDKNLPENENGFTTIMAYPRAFKNATPIDVISNPYIYCTTNKAHYPCGIDKSNPEEGADGASTLQSMLGIYSSYRASEQTCKENFEYEKLWRVGRVETSSCSDSVVIDGIILESELDTADGSDHIYATKILRGSVFAGNGENNISIGTTAYDSQIISGSGYDNIIIGGNATRLTLSSGDGDDYIRINGDVYEGNLQSGLGNDVLEITGINFVRGSIDMGAGDDTLILAGERSEYTIEYIGDYYTIGSVHKTYIYNVENIRFGDGVVIRNGTQI